MIAQARAQGMEFELLSPAQIQARHPFLELDGIRAALWDPYDGDIDPAQLTQALAKGARDRGATDPSAHPGDSASGGLRTAAGASRRPAVRSRPST